MPGITPLAGAHAEPPGLVPARLPNLVRNFAERVLPDGGSVPTTVRVTQTGDMWRAPGARPLHFDAVEEFTVDEVAFSWHADVTIAPFVTIHVDDGFAAGKGSMRARFGRISFMNKRGPDLDTGEAMRYLAEIPWVPFAILANTQFTWNEIDENRVEVSTVVGASPVAVTLEFNALGEIVSAHAGARPRHGDVPRPWTGHFSDYAVLGGVRIPRAAEVAWTLPTGTFTYWRGSVTDLELISEED